MSGKTVSPLTTEEILPVVYEELRRIATDRLRHESRQFTLQPTALVHEAWLRLSGGQKVTWENRAHFFGAAAQAMRRILVDRAREKSAAKRQVIAPEEALDAGFPGGNDHVLLIHECLIQLEQSDPISARIVLLKFYAGLGNREIADLVGRSVRSVERQWMFARAKLFQMIQAERSNSSS
ncbi:RNA polymerase sigma factor (TIGR02999 family) [Haloferula luteola]|uniref:RNA polymerase sigma factor (TIGR02999 family) n=1 Tax=Haloferula luteola TaxID=595692 RepID=A0A840VCX7_9BACT|nr:ECF-type sigma factor [Haloferula luteola]MBB5351659.1 RNA polymerase sigma factor (TIGR02999 family) [Haloferula luteola]